MDADEIKLIHQKVNDIISKPSRWFFNWGIIVTFMTIVLLIGVSFIVPYKEELNCKLYFQTQHDILPFKSPVNGIIKKYTVTPDSKVIKGQSIIMVEIPTTKKTIPLYASNNGYYQKSAFQPKAGDSIKKDEIIFNILPDITQKDELYCIGYLDKFNISKLEVGNNVTITIEQYDKQFLVNGKISNISNYPVKNNSYPFYVNLNLKDVAYLNEQKSFYYKMNANALIIYKTQKFANKFFTFLN